MRQITFSAVSAAVLGTMLGGCVIHVGGQQWQDADYARETTLEVPHEAGRVLDVDTHNGKIEVVRGGTGSVRVEAEIYAISRERANTVEIVARQDGDTLHVHAKWPERRKSNERVSFVVTIPDVEAVLADTSNGSILVEGLDGDHALETSNGKIRIKDGEGELRVRTSNGSVVLEGWEGDADLRTSNGAISVREHEGGLRAETSNGRIDADTNGSPVYVRTSNGSIDLELGPDFEGRLDAGTSHYGRLTLKGDTQAARISSLEKNHLVLQVGDSAEHQSKVRTSNGAVRIHLARKESL